MRYTAVIEHHVHRSCTTDAKRWFRNRIHSNSNCRATVVVREYVRNVNRHHYTYMYWTGSHRNACHRVVPKLIAPRQYCNIIGICLFFFPFELGPTIRVQSGSLLHDKSCLVNGARRQIPRPVDGDIIRRRNHVYVIMYAQRRVNRHEKTFGWFVEFVSTVLVGSSVSTRFRGLDTSRRCRMLEFVQKPANRWQA